MAATAAVTWSARTAAPQDDNCEQESRPWSPSSAEDYSDMPGLISASPPGPPQAPRPYGQPYAYQPPVLSPVRHFLEAPPRDSSDYPVQMDLEEPFDPADELPPLLRVDAMGGPLGFNWLGTSFPDPWTEQPQQQQRQTPQQERHQQQRQRQRHGEDEEWERINALSSLTRLRPPRAAGQRSRPSSRRTTGPQTARPAWPAAQPAQQQDTQDVSARTRRHIDALYATAVQQVWSRTARLSADLLGWNPEESDGARLRQQLQPLLRMPRPEQLQQQQQQEQQQQEEQREYVQLQQVPLPLEFCRPPAHCSFLQAGMTFVGGQKLLQRGSLRQEDQWGVQVVLHDVDVMRGRLSGSMRAINVTGAAGPIDTYFEGDIVDDINNCFWTHAWGASRETDMRHWSKFENFADIKPLVTKHAGRCGKLQQHPTIYMRWKEQFFVNTNEQCGLTIAGFYYVALNRSTGAMRGLYYDPASSPFQELSLQVDHSPSSSSSSSSQRSSTTDCVDGTLSSSGSSVTCGRGVGFASYAFA